MLDTGIIWTVVAQPRLLAVLGLSILLAWPIGTLIGRGLMGAAFVVILGAVLAATTTTRTPFYSTDGIDVYLSAFADPAGIFRGFAGSGEKLANIGLFVPPTALATWLWQRPTMILGAAAALSFIIEGWQGFIGRGGDAVDVMHNSAGALVGACVGFTFLAAKRRREAPTFSAP